MYLLFDFVCVLFVGGGAPVKAVFCSAMNNESQAFALKMFQKYMAAYNMQVDVQNTERWATDEAQSIMEDFVTKL